MILTGSEIAKEIRRGNIEINPYNRNNINPNSYNYHLGNQLLEITNKIIDPLLDYLK